MADRPILFQGAMVRANLADTKTQTRRVVKPTTGRPIDFVGGGPKGGADWNNPECWGYEQHDSGIWVLLKPTDASEAQYPCPYGMPGDRLWVKETYFAFGRWETRFSAKKGRDEWHFVDMTLECDRAYQYAADGAPQMPAQGKRHGGVTPGWWKRPAIFMPRAASRITLEIADVHVERLQEISEADAEAEGVAFMRRVPDVDETLTGRQLYACLWDSINGADSWDVNPWVWAVS
ncbi:MAG: hypothetical protein EOO21_07015, partial [Comamonadaceae bacterium]